MDTDTATSPTDADLLAAVADGDWDAFATIYDRHAPWLLARLRYRCSDAALVEEAVQETFFGIWRGTARFRAQRSNDAAGWLWRIASRRLIDAMRGTSRRERLLSRLVQHRRDEEPSAEDRALVGVEHGDLARALEQLSPELRQVLQVTVLDGLTTAEAAQLLGIPRGTVKTRAMRARLQLREELA